MTSPPFIRGCKFALNKKAILKSFFDKTLIMVRCPNNPLLKISLVHHVHMIYFEDVSIFLASIERFSVFFGKKQGLLYFLEL